MTLDDNNRQSIDLHQIVLVKNLFNGIAGIYQFLRFIVLGTAILLPEARSALVFGSGTIVLAVLFLVEAADPDRRIRLVLILGKTIETIVTGIVTFRVLGTSFVGASDVILYISAFVGDTLILAILLLWRSRIKTVDPAEGTPNPPVLPEFETIEIEEE